MGNAKKGFESVQKLNRENLMADCVRVYWENGYTFWKNFSDYFFMFNPETSEKVRLYYNGNIREN